MSSFIYINKLSIFNYYFYYYYYYYYYYHYSVMVKQSLFASKLVPMKCWALFTKNRFLILFPCSLTFVALRIL